MHIHNIGGLIWVVLVIIGIMSSIRNSAKKTRGETRPPAPPAAASRGVLDATAAQVAERLSGALSARMMTAAPLEASQQPPLAQPRPAALRVPVRAQAQPVVSPIAPTAVTPQPHNESTESLASGVLGGIFEDRKTMLRAIVAAEVLGSPKALQEQTLWSPRHSEPSI